VVPDVRRGGGVEGWVPGAAVSGDGGGGVREVWGGDCGGVRGKVSNSANSPLYLLCFAAGNEKGAPIAWNIANHLLTRGDD